HNGGDNTQDQEPDGPVTRGTGEKFREARAQRGRGLHPKDDEHHTDHEQGHPHDALHTSVLLCSASLIRQEACQLLRIIPASVSYCFLSPFSMLPYMSDSPLACSAGDRGVPVVCEP